MSRVVVIGCGVVGAAIAYELSQVSGLKVTVLDRQPPAQASTGAALGVLMGVISHKIKGSAWKMRQTSIQRYETLIPELEALTGRQIPFNRQGILMLLLRNQQPENAGEDLAAWEKLVEIRQSQGWHLEIWDTAQLQSKCPHLNIEKFTGAVYSPQDRQVEPTALTNALVDAAQRNGVTFQFGVSVDGVATDGLTDVTDGLSVAREAITHPLHLPPFSRGARGDQNPLPLPLQLQTTAGQLECDWLVVAAGLGSNPLTASLKQLVDIRPVLGQALHLRLESLLGNPDFQPVITGDDVHVVPVGKGEYWVGATVEFPNPPNPPLVRGGEAATDPPLVTGGEAAADPPSVRGGEAAADPPLVRGGEAASNLPLVRGGQAAADPLLVTGGEAASNLPLVRGGQAASNLPTPPLGKGGLGGVDGQGGWGDVVADAAKLDAVMQQAIAFCPTLAEATVIRTWSGLRPRPEGRPAPVIGLLPGYSNVLLATGHYRNGVLLAPATALAIREAIVGVPTPR